MIYNRQNPFNLHGAVFVEWGIF